MSVKEVASDKKQMILQSQPFVNRNRWGKWAVSEKFRENYNSCFEDERQLVFKNIKSSARSVQARLEGRKHEYKNVARSL